MWDRYKSYITELIKIAVISAVIIIPIRVFLIHPFIVKGVSMEETFLNNDYLIVNRLNYRLHKPQRGDIIVFKSPLNLKDHLIKRVIAVPGETVEIREGYVFVKNGEYPQGRLLDESQYLDSDVVTYPDGTFKIEDGYYFLMGDNRKQSMDSRIFGPVHESLIVGQAWVRGWPFNRAKVFDHILYPGL